MRIGVLGGTFDPPHVGHLMLAEQAREQLQLDRVLFIPAGDPWRKAGRDVAPATHRLALTRLAVEDNDAFVVDDREVRRQGPTYSVDTLRELRAELGPETEFFFIVGQDALADLPYWHDPAGIAEAALIAVVERGGAESPHSLPFEASRLLHLEMPAINISSTGMRQRVRAGHSLRYMTPHAVEAYIREHKLYG